MPVSGVDDRSPTQESGSTQQTLGAPAEPRPERAKTTQVSEFKKAMESLKKEIKRLPTHVDMTLARYFTTSDERRSEVVATLSENIETVLSLMSEVSEPTIAEGTGASDSIIATLCEIYVCLPSNLVSVAIESNEKMNNLQIDHARLKKKLLDKRREELMGANPINMEGEQVTPQNETIRAREATLTPFQSKAKASRSAPERTPSLFSGRTGTSSEEENEDLECFCNRKQREESSSVREYFRSLAMPNIKPFDSERSQKFEDFIRAFNLKYPEGVYRDNDRKEIMVGYLEGEAKLHYKTLPKTVRYGTFDSVVLALKNRMRLENQEARAEALRSLRLLSKRESQTVMQFCLELETLTAKAHAGCDEAALALIRAEALHEQLRDWPEAYHLSEILSSEDAHGVYDRMKGAALRIERIRKHRRDASTKKPDKPERRGPLRYLVKRLPASESTSKAESEDLKTTEVKGRDFKQPDSKPSSVKCSNCGKKGHSTEDCWAKKPNKKGSSSFSAVVEKWACKVSTPDKEVDALVGPKHLVTLKCLGMEVTAMIDTGSQLTIMPLSILTSAKAFGADLDSLCKEKETKRLEVFDASGNKMDFLGCMETTIELLGGAKANIQMYVKRMKDDIVLLGTNALGRLGVSILIAPNKVPSSLSFSPQGDNLATITRRRGSGAQMSTAFVAKRSYVKPGGCNLIQVRCHRKSGDTLLWSQNDLIQSGVCTVSEGIAEIPVLNNSDEPIVFKEGESVGKWSRSKWIDPRLLDPKSDMLELAREPLEPRLETLMSHLASNRTSSNMPEKLKELVAEFADVFSISDHELTQTDLVEHDIDTGSTRPIKQKVRPVPRGVQSEFKAILSDLETRGIIERSASDWASPVVLVQKKDKTLRLCVDYRALNKHTRQDSYPLPTIDTVLQSLGGKRYFSTLDMAAGYWQVKLTKEAQRKSAFITPEGLFEFKVLPFGLCTSPAVFQRLMDVVLAELRGEDVFVYIDDILVATETEEKHYDALRKVFLAFRKAKLRLKSKKCSLLENRVAFLGHVLDESGVKTDPDKIEKVLNYPRPKNVSELRTFLGMCGYYRKFILNFSKIAKELYSLTSSRIQYRWGKEHDKAFENLKNAVANAPVLGQPDVKAAQTGERPYIIYTDASTHGVGAVLCQEGNDKMLHPLYFASKRLSRAEERYHITDLEALAIVFALRKFHFFVFGVKTKIRTDHQPLTSLFKRSNVSPRVMRWALEIQSYQLEIEYVKGDANRVADAMSRGLPTSLAALQDNTEPERVVNAIIAANTWRQELQEDPDYGPIIDMVIQGKNQEEIKLPRHEKPLRVADFCIMDDHLCLILEDGSFAKVVPRSRRRAVFDEAHAGVLAGHFNARKIFQKLKKVVFWEGMRQDIALWSKQCRQCYLTNNQKGCTPPLKPIEASSPFEVVGVDVLEMGLSSSGMRYLVVVIDHFSKWLAAYPTPSKSAEDIARALFHRWICEGGRWPKTLLSDKGREFENNVMEALCKVAGISQSFTKGYNPRENGVTERANQTLVRMLKKRGGVTADWDKMVPNAIYAYNVSPHSATGESPFFTLYGFDPVYPSSEIPSDEISPYRIDMDDYRTELMSGLKLTQDLIREKAAEYRKKMKEHYDRRAETDVKRLPQVGSRVFLKQPMEKAKTRHPKLCNVWSGPYRVIETSENSALVTEIEGKAEPIRVPHDQLRVVPSCFDDTPLKTKTKRRVVREKEKSSRVCCTTIAQDSFFRSYPKQLIMTDDLGHPLHVQFQCHERGLAKPPGDFNGYRLGVQCPLSAEKDANCLEKVLGGLPDTMKTVRFDSVCRLAQLVQIWVEDGLSEKEKLMEMARKVHDFSAEALAVALLYYREKCLHFQLSEEKLEPQDFYHEHIRLGSAKKRMSGIFQTALSSIVGKNWQGPWQRPKRVQTLVIPKSMENVLVWLPETVKGFLYDPDPLPIPEEASDVLLVVGKLFASPHSALNLLHPWLEKIQTRDVNMVVAMAPREHNQEQNITAWENVAKNVTTVLNSTSTVVPVTWLGADAPPEQWDNPIRCLGSDPYDEHGIMGHFRCKLWYEKVVKYWTPSWPSSRQTARPDPAARKRSRADQENMPYRAGRRGYNRGNRDRFPCPQASHSSAHPAQQPVPLFPHSC